MTGMGGNQLRNYIERIERLEEQRKALADDIAEIYKEMSGDGYDKYAAKIVLKIRRDADALNVWRERSETVDLYLAALGMLVEARAPARAREIIEKFGSAVDLNDSGTAPRAAADESAQLIPVSSAAVNGGTTATALPVSAYTEIPASSSPDPRTSVGLTAGNPEKSSNDAGAKSDGPHPIVGQDGDKPGHYNGQLERQEASAAQDRNEPVSASGATATIPDDDVPAFIKAAKPLRPYCQNPKVCAGVGFKHCYSCSRAAGLTEAA